LLPSQVADSRSLREPDLKETTMNRSYPTTSLAALALGLTAGVALAQDPLARRDDVPPQARLDALVGTYDVAARIHAAPGAEPITGTGEATLAPSHGGAFVHETFTLDVGGRRVAGDAWYAWREKAGRYELTQVDDANPVTLWLVGAWDADRGRLAFHDLADARAPGMPALRWEVRMNGDGFTKEMLRPNGAGAWTVASEYVYTRREREVERPDATHVAAMTRVPMVDGPTAHVLVDVMLNGQGPFRMILDTGAATTVLDGDLVTELGLESLGTTRIGDPSDLLANEVDQVRIGTVELGSARFEGVAAVGWRGPSLTSAIGARGVLGLPTFRDCLLTVDYPARAIEVAPGELPEVDGKRVLPLDSRMIAELPVAVAGREASAHLDIGNASSLVVPASWQGELATKGEVSEGMGMRASGPVTFTIATLDGDLVIGEHVLHDPEVRFDDRLDHVNVGYGVLRGFAITLDQRNDRVRLTPGEPSSAAPLPAGAREAPGGDRRRLGAALGLRSDGVAEVRMVMPSSAAEAAGLAAGDVIVTVDGKPATNDALMGALAGAASIRLGVRRGDAELELVLYE